jgi:hypothetical protein
MLYSYLGRRRKKKKKGRKEMPTKGGEEIGRNVMGRGEGGLENKAQISISPSQLESGVYATEQIRVGESRKYKCSTR